ncbi:MAG: hypothetical protein AUI36_29720 [Cyanobacteria bacterium 13_1_40CM_2_61_4]|nr:MAG: hypothetical protein AUI36_29720 [Cyanobacteria bacterium 13_1_40CM_2_61_4]
MDRLTLSISLEYEHTGAFVIRWVIFNDYSINNSSHDIVDENVIVCQLVITMVRDVYFPEGN